MTSVFISYSRHDSATAQRLATDLGRAGFSVFLDTERMRAGSFAEQLDQAIARCDVFVLLISESSVRSVYVLRELHVAADDHERPILPVVLDDADASPFRLLIAGLQRVEYSPGNDLQTAAVVDGIYRTMATFRRSQPTGGSAFVRGVGRLLSTVGVVMIVGGMGYFFVLFAQAWNESDPTVGPPEGFPIALGAAFAGMVVGAVGGALVRAGRRRPRT